jgi:hypothetical protein
MNTKFRVAAILTWSAGVSRLEMQRNRMTKRISSRLVLCPDLYNTELDGSDLRCLIG